MQRIQYAKTKSDIIAKADGTFVPRERRKRHEEKGKICVSPYKSIELHVTLGYRLSNIVLSCPVEF